MEEGMMGTRKISVARKRTFLQDAFFPFGPSVCDRLGLVPASPDVALSEMASVEVRHRQVTNSEVFDEITNMAQWYVDAATAADEINLPMTRTPAEHFVAFYVAAHDTIGGH